MRICILTVGTRGDVQPYVALGTALRAAGHEVKLATLGRFEALVRAYGLEFALFEESPLSFLERVIASGGSFLRRAYETKGILDSMMGRLLADALRFAQEADLIITSNLLIYPGYQLSKLLSVPSIGTLLVPYLRTRVFPNPAFCSGRRSLTGPGNLLTYDIFNEAVWQLYRGSMNRHQRRFGFRPLPSWGMAGQMLRDHYPFLCAYSPSIVPRPADWSDGIHVTGYWFLDAPAHWEPPAALQAFLDAGPPPVYIGFGSMTSAGPAGVARLIVEALEQSGQRGVVQNDSLGISQVDASGEVLLLNSTPHDWLFPQMAAVVHHGGAGTTAAGLRAGVPTITSPAYGDQFFWGQRIAELGAGPPPIPRKHLTADRLATAIRLATNDHRMHERARVMAQEVGAEEGVTRAVRLIEGILGAWNRQR